MGSDGVTTGHMLRIERRGDMGKALFITLLCEGTGYVLLRIVLAVTGHG